MDLINDSESDLRKDVRLLGQLLGSVLSAEEGVALFDTVETLRSEAKQVIAGNLTVTDLAQSIASLEEKDMVGITRAFSQFLNLANLAEQHHRVRRRRWYECQESAASQPGSLGDFFGKMKGKVSKQDLHQAIKTLSIELVLTAHPTEVTRRTLMSKYDRIMKELTTLDRVDVTPREHQNILANIEREIMACWKTDEIREVRPTPIDEAKWGFAVIETVLWQALPEFMRELDGFCEQALGERLPLTASPIQIGSWMGGDRDGNPFVTARVTQEAVLLSRWMAADLIAKSLDDLGGMLSMRNASPKLKAVVGEVKEPYRALLKTLRNKMIANKGAIESALKGETISPEALFIPTETVLAPLLLCYESLCDAHAPILANGALLDLIRCVSAFGTHLVKLDVRQESTRHADLLDEITKALDLKPYHALNETEREQFLLQELHSKRPLLANDLVLSQEGQETLDTFMMLRKTPKSSFGVYVISMCSTVCDILEVYLLQKMCGEKNYIPVVPLFETEADLKNAPICIEALFSLPWFQGVSQNHMQVMIGYSDSAKEAGFLAASFAQYEAQEALTAIAEKHHVHLTLFHGRGGSVGRGGAPTHLAILSQPPGSVRSRIRVTEQGEVIRTKFGEKNIAIRSFSLYTTAVLEATLLPGKTPKPVWRQTMQCLSEHSAKAYRDLVFKKAEFYPYFQEVTPIKALSLLNVGSRPAKRRPQTGVESLRAIPWIFAWTQNRLLLPTWFGVAEAFEQMNDPKLLQEMRTEWPFFGSLLSMLEMILAKVDTGIASWYHTELDNGHEALHAMLLERVKACEHTVKQLLQTGTLLQSSPILFRSMSVRAPYVLVLNILQVKLLKMHRASETPSEAVLKALLISIAGVAAGMRNTG